MITVLHTESSLSWGGQEMRIMGEILGLSRESFRPFLACQPASQFSQKAEAQGVDFELIKMRSNIDPLSVVQFIRLYHRRKVNIVHTHSNADSWNASIAAKFSPSRPIVVRTRHLSVPFNNRLIYNCMADQVITVGEAVCRYMIREKGIHPQKVLAISSGVDVNKFNPEKVRGNLRDKLGIPPDALVFGTAAIFRKNKGHRFLLEAAPTILETFPGARLLLAGEGPQKGNLLRLIDAKQLHDTVVMPGFIDDMPRLLNSMDVFVFPSLEEAYPNAILEAMAMQKPIVATRVGGIPDILEDGQTGYLVEPRNADAIGDRVVNLLSDQKLRSIMGRKGRQVALENNQQIMIEKLERLYFNLMEKFHK